MTAAPQNLPHELRRAVESTPGETATRELLAWLASAELASRAEALRATKTLPPVATIAAAIGAPGEALQLWLARDIAAVIGETVEARIRNAAGEIVIVEFAPAERSVSGSIKNQRFT
jgi:hypothetical protein